MHDFCNCIFHCRIPSWSSDATRAVHGALSNIGLQQRIPSSSRTNSAHASTYATRPPHALVSSTWYIHNRSPPPLRISEHSWWPIHLWIRVVSRRRLDTTLESAGAFGRFTCGVYARNGSTFATCDEHLRLRGCMLSTPSATMVDGIGSLRILLQKTRGHVTSRSRSSTQGWILSRMAAFVVERRSSDGSSR